MGSKARCNISMPASGNEAGSLESRNLRSQMSAQLIPVSAHTLLMISWKRGNKIAADGRGLEVAIGAWTTCLQARPGMEA